MTAIDALLRLVAPPADPVDGRGDWQQVEAALGLPLPSDFKALTTHYGLGQFVGFITPLTPFGSRDLLLGAARRLLDGERAFRDQHPDRCPHPFHPEPGGLLPWAGTDNGDRLCWLTEGDDPDAWPVVAWNPRSWRYETHRTGAAGFLHAWLSGQVTTTVFGPNAHTAAPWFEPHRELAHVSLRLTTGPLTHAERLGILRAALAPTADRGGYARGDARRDRFAATARGWNLTHATAAHGHQIRVAFPPQDEALVRSVLLAAVGRMGCEVLSATTDRGRPAWT